MYGEDRPDVPKSKRYVGLPSGTDCPLCHGTLRRMDYTIKPMLPAVSDEETAYRRKKGITKVGGHCKNCGVLTTQEGKMINESGQEINMFGDTQDYG